MVQLMKGGGGSESQREKRAAVKREVEDYEEEVRCPINKRPKSLGMSGLKVPLSQFNPLDEPSPLGLRLRKSPSLLELIQTKLSQSAMLKVEGQDWGTNEVFKTSSASNDKLKASNFPGSLLRIGTWEYKSRHEGDLVAKCYFAKHKLVWEVLDGGLKNKIEIQWSDIIELRGSYDDDALGTLNVKLARPPLFFRETNPQPRKHTLWQATPDFTGGQASIHREHFLECPPGLMGKHFEKLINCDPRLYFISRQRGRTMVSKYFEPGTSAFDDQNENKDNLDSNMEGSSSLFSLQDTASPSGTHSFSSKNDVDSFSRHSGSYPYETPSPSSAMEVLAGDTKIDQFKEVSKWDQITAPGMRSSMSMTDLVNHLESRISEQNTSRNLALSSEEWESLQILDDINRCLFSESQNLPDSNVEKSLMSRVNSLCCLIQRDNNNPVFECEDKPSELFGVLTDKKADNLVLTDKKADNPVKDEDDGGSNMSRKDSVGELLMDLPRIASLPQFLFNV